MYVDDGASFRSALLGDCPEHGLVRGQVGTVVELLSPALAEVDSATMRGVRILHAEELIRLHHRPLEQVA